MLAAKVKEFLSIRGVQYELISHPTTYTAQQTAENLHIRGEELAKSVIVKMDGAFALAVLPTSRHADLSVLQSATGARAIRLASEIELKTAFRTAKSAPYRLSEISTDCLFLSKRS